MNLPRRRPLTGRSLLSVSSLIGFAVFFVFVLDGAEVVRSALAGVATAVWIAVMIAGLNWYNRIRTEAVERAIADATSPESNDAATEARESPRP